MLWVDFLPIFLFLIKHKYIGKNLFVFFYCLLSFVSQILILILISAHIQTANSIIFYHIFNTILLLIYFRQLIKFSNKKLMLFFFIYLISVFECYISKRSLDFFAIESMLFILIFSVTSLIKTLKFNNIKLGKIDIRFIFSILIYNSSSLILFYILPNIVKPLLFVWVFHNIIEMLSKILITLSIWKLQSKSDY